MASFISVPAQNVTNLSLICFHSSQGNIVLMFAETLFII